MAGQYRHFSTVQAQPSYSAYLIRLWQEMPSGSWRASAQSVHSGKIVRFGSIDALLAFLEAEINETTEDAASKNRLPYRA